MKQIYTCLFFLWIWPYEVLKAQDQEFIASAKEIIQNYYSKLDIIHDLEHPLSAEEISLVKHTIIDEIILKDNGKNLYDNITKTDLFENYYDPAEYLKYFIAKYEEFTIEHQLNFIRSGIILRSNNGRKIIPMIYEVTIHQVQNSLRKWLRTDTLVHNIIFKNIDGKDINDICEIQNTEKFLPKKAQYISQIVTLEELDTDHDGFKDNDDVCPGIAGTVKGCPDRDKDGWADIEDQCPDFLGTILGCPDSDGDQVIDKQDKCPNEAGPASNLGCPVNVAVLEKAEEVVDKLNDSEAELHAKKQDFTEKVSSRYLEIPLSLAVLTRTSRSRNYFGILSQQPIVDTSSQEIVLQGTEEFYAEATLHSDRWEKTVTYDLDFDHIKLKSGKTVKLHNSKMSLQYAEGNNKTDNSGILKIDLNAEKDLSKYLEEQY